MHCDTPDVNALFQAQFGQPLSAVLAPISEQDPCGPSLRSNGVYSAIETARSEDDASLPMGQWEHQLKVADWPRVSSLALDALSHKSKDLQLAMWLLEAQIQQFGFDGITPAVYLLKELSQTYWADIHPQMQDDDIEYRTNLIRWANDKLPATIRQISLTDKGNTRQCCWSDWELANQIEQLPQQQRPPEGQYLSVQNIISGIAATNIEFYRHLHETLSLAANALEAYSDLLDQLCAKDAPSLATLMQLLVNIDKLIVAQTAHRGLLLAPESEDESITAQATHQASASGGDGNHGAGKITSRQAAYQMLSDVAEYLQRDDPHSPAPYLLLKAIEWGQLNTAQLYQQLFMEYQGQLNIFELLGLELDKTKGGSR